MARSAVLRRIEVLEVRAGKRPVDTEPHRKMERLTSFLRTDPVLRESWDTIGEWNPSLRLSERLNRPEKIEAAKRIAEQLAALLTVEESRPG